MADFSHLSAPLCSGRLELKNRIVHAAILTRFAESERATERLIAYHANRARGGVAMIITEAVNALPMQAGRSHYLNAHSEAGIADLARLADAVHGHDCRILAQLQERGRGNYD
ncbi:MAG: oxidoreductase, partial [Hyphomicrobiaceae bacterium]